MDGVFAAGVLFLLADFDLAVVVVFGLGGLEGD